MTKQEQNATLDRLNETLALIEASTLQVKTKLEQIVKLCDDCDTVSYVELFKTVQAVKEIAKRALGEE